MFKILILQRYYGLGDKQTEYQILDRTSLKLIDGYVVTDASVHNSPPLDDLLNQ